MVESALYIQASYQFTMNFGPTYRLISNDDVCVKFAREQLQFCDYAKNIFTDADGNWESEEGSDELRVYPMNGAELDAFCDFLKIRASHSMAPRIRETRPVITDCPLYVMPHRLAIGNFMYLPPIISINNLGKWKPRDTGLTREYHTFLDVTLPQVTRVEDEPESEVIQRWIRFAKFLGCDDLLYLLEVKFLWHVSDALEAHAGLATTRYTFEPNYFEKLVETLRTIHYMEGECDVEYMKRLRDYALTFWDIRYEDPAYIAYIVRKYLLHRGPPMPRESWTSEQWHKYRMTVSEVYTEAEARMAEAENQ